MTSRPLPPATTGDRGSCTDRDGDSRLPLDARAHRGLGQARRPRGGLVPGAEVHLVEIQPEAITAGRWPDDDVMALLERSDAIVLGSPTLRGGVSAVFKAFLEAAFPPWTTSAWKDKLAGGFTNSASQSGDKLATLEQLAFSPHRWACSGSE